MTSNQIKYWDLEERKRSNRVNEVEVHRANRAREDETNRHNVAVETETNRHNIAVEGMTLQQVSELQRHNQATEVQAAADLQERHRANVEQEHIGRLNVGLGYARLNEENRHNLASEQNTLYSILETQRSNRQREAYTADTLEETKRSNAAREEQNRLNWLTEVGGKTEQSRHNKASEENTREYNDQSIRHKYFDTLIRGINQGYSTVVD